MKIKNIAVGDSVQVKKELACNIFKAKQVCEVIKIDSEHEFRPDVLIKGECCLGWVNHNDIKKPTQRKPEPQLKQLDQSVFDGLDEKWKFAAVDEDGEAFIFDTKAELLSECWDVMGGDGCERIKGNYDTSNWQNSLIERDIAKELLEVNLSSELTGSELCKAMLARGDILVACKSSDYSEYKAIKQPVVTLIKEFNDTCFRNTNGSFYRYVVPINLATGEPLTQAEAGL